MVLAAWAFGKTQLYKNLEIFVQITNVQKLIKILGVSYFFIITDIFQSNVSLFHFTHLTT